MAQNSPARDPKKDHLITPENSVIVFIDYQPSQFQGVRSKSPEELMLNVTTLAKVASEYSLPAVLSTVGVEMGVNSGSIRELREAFPELKEIDRSTLNAWEDEEFRRTVQEMKRKKIIIS